MAEINQARLPIRDFFPGVSNDFLSGITPSPLFSLAAGKTSLDSFQRELRPLSCKPGQLKNSLCCDITWLHPETGLEAEVRYVAFQNTKVLEIEGRIFNRGRKIVRDVRGAFSLYLSCDLKNMGMPRVTTVHGGSSTDGCYPPPAYRVSETNLTPHGGLSLLCGREGGRSTEQVMPYAILTDANSTQGFFMALEWPCRSVIQMSVEGQRHFLMYAHPAWASLDLKPGESIVMPKVDLGFFQGDSLAGSNALRRHITQNVMRPVTDGSPLPPVFYNHYYGLYNDWDETTMKREADAYSELGAEYFVVDAGWYLEDFRKGIGNWEKEDPKRFPSGMTAFSQYVRSKGMKFGAWLEIEFAMKNSDWGKRHHDWFREATNKQNTMYGGRRFDDLLLRLEDVSVRSQVADFLEQWVNKYQIEWLRWDFNNTPLPFWQAHEEVERMGWLHFGYGEGLLALLDDFMKRCPQVHIEACAGGGHRMDLGTLRRAHSAWMNDNSHSYDAIRCYQKGLNRVLPGNYGNSCFLWVTHERQRLQSLASLRKHGYPSCVMRSRMAGTLGFAEQSIFWTPAIRKELRSEIEKYKAIRPFILKDFYPLFEPRSLKEFDGWQFNDPETGEGYSMFFRCDADKDSTNLILPGMDKGTTYQLYDLDSDKTRKVKGGQTLKVEIPDPNGTRWFRYRP